MRTALLAACIFIWSCSEEKEQAPQNNSLSVPDSLQASIKKFPDSALLREELIQFYRDKGNFAEALKVTREASGRDSLNPRWFDIEAILHFENEDTLRSIRAFEKAVSIFPSPEYLIPLGTLYAQTRNPRAINVADLLLSSEIARAEKESYYIKGLYHTYAGDKKKAIQFFDRALEVSFTFMEAYREKAIALYELGRYAEGLAVLDKAVTLQNNFDEGHYYRGKLLEKMGRNEEASEAYRMALMFDPEYTEAKEAYNRLNPTK